MTNWVKNAVEHGDAAGADVESTADETQWRLTVRNDGPPISAERLERIFAPFQRGVRSAGESGDGIGLGLFIVQAIVLAHEGSIEVTSSALGGTRFCVRLPLAGPHLESSLFESAPRQTL